MRDRTWRASLFRKPSSSSIGRAARACRRRSARRSFPPFSPGGCRLEPSFRRRELATQGYLEVADRSSYRVADKPPFNVLGTDVALPDADAVDWSSKLRSTFRVAKQMRKPLDWRRYPYPFLYGQMDPSLFDLAAWRDCARRALAREDFELMAGDFAASDDVQLVNYICSRTLPGRGIRANPDEIL
eukprot:gene7141-9096_t